MSIDGRNHWFPQTVWAEIGKLFNRYTTMTVLLCEHDNDDDDDDNHDTTRLRAVRRRNVTTPTTAEMNSEESILRFIVNKGVKSQPHVEGSTKKTRKCTAACVRTNKGDRCTGGAADTAAVAAAAASFCCNDAMQKTYRSAQQHDRSSACNKTTADCRGQCPRTGKYVVNDNPQSTGTRSYRANEGQCTVAAAKCVANDHPKCTSTRSHRANEGQCTGAGTGNYGANHNRCTDIGNYRANEGQCTGANHNRCTDIGNYRANDGQCTGTGNYGTNNGECNGCGCISTAAAVAATACLGGSNAFGRGNTDTLVSTVYKWAKVAMDWTWDKKSYLLVAAVSFFLGIYICDLCLCTCEDTY